MNASVKPSQFHVKAILSGLVTETQWQSAKQAVYRQMAAELAEQRTAPSRDASEPAREDSGERPGLPPGDKAGDKAGASPGEKAGASSGDESLDPEHRLRQRDERLAEWFIQAGILTRYQAVQLMAGRSKLTLGPYVITDWIGQGGMGQVFKAVHKVMGRESAVKVLPAERSTPESRESFLREIRLQAGLDCPYLVRAFDAGEDGGVHYLVTEYVPGTDLRRLVRRRGPLPMDQAASVIMQAALGLDYAHRLGLVHRDVKPGNILVTPEGHAKVSDVGLAAWSMGLEDDPRAGKIVGTVDYISPEQIRSPRQVGPASDIYSLGCTMYYALCGKVPYPGGDSISKCRRHCEETPWHPRKFVPELDEELIEIIADMMEKDPERRIATAAEVAERLEPWAGGIGDIAERPFDDGHWATPPPPAESDAGDPEDPPTPQVSSSDDVSISGPVDITPPPLPESSLPGSTLPGSTLPGSTLPGSGAGPFPTAASNTVGLTVAITLAIAVPLCLLIGAILGFIIHASL
ncbi:serine/threonine protein kinase [Roseimaritima sediminicola]|uniref:serine/threonine protein kinase n=1 Tax=Roseimaritima sediminicola TaxID=2662066 RepID=UPI001EEE414F|nr:serine/threonine-protein kinase [Roseimaritima sediminicola]